MLPQAAIAGCAITGPAPGTWIWNVIPGCRPGGTCTCMTPLGVCTCIGMPPCMPCGTWLGLGLGLGLGLVLGLGWG